MNRAFIDVIRYYIFSDVYFLMKNMFVTQMAHLFYMTFLESYLHKSALLYWILFIFVGTFSHGVVGHT